MGTARLGMGIKSAGKRDRHEPQKNDDMRWLAEDTERRQIEAEREMRARRRRLAERDLEYAKAFPDLVRRGRMAHDVESDMYSELRRRFVG